MGWLWKETKGVDQTLKREETIGIDLNIEIDWEKRGENVDTSKKGHINQLHWRIGDQKSVNKQCPKKYTKKKSPKSA